VGRAAGSAANDCLADVQCPPQTHAPPQAQPPPAEAWPPALGAPDVVANKEKRRLRRSLPQLGHMVLVSTADIERASSKGRSQARHMYS
jgi:hypothetical protein